MDPKHRAAVNRLASLVTQLSVGMDPKALASRVVDDLEQTTAEDRKSLDRTIERMPKA